MKIIFIGGTGRTGSTFYGQALARTIENSVFVGETFRGLVNENMIERNLPCGCGCPISDCEFWKGFLENQDDSLGTTISKNVRMRNVFSKSKMAVAEGYYENIIKYVAENTDANTIIDSSKNPSTLAALAQLKNIDLEVRHLVRSPLSTINSWAKDKKYLASRSFLSSAVDWAISNLLIEIVVKLRKINYTRVSYNNLYKELENNKCYPDTFFHSVAGNPSKFDKKQAFKSHDDSTEQKALPFLKRIVLLSMVKIFFRRYGL